MKKFAILLSLALVVSMAAGAQTETINVSSTTGSFSNNGGKEVRTDSAERFAMKWTSTSSLPQVTFSNINERNNLGILPNAWKLYAKAQGNVYRLTISQGYRITGYKITFVASTPHVMMTTVLPKSGQTSKMDVPNVATLDVVGLHNSSVSFSLSSGAENVLIASFAVTYERVASPKKTTLFSTTTSVAPYRIPAITTLRNGDLLAVCDYRIGGGDPGQGKIDLVGRISKDNGATWGPQFTVAKHGDTPRDNCYGDASLVADRKSNNVLLQCSTGSVFYSHSKPGNPLRAAQLRSRDGGKTWTKPKDVTEEIYGLFKGRKDGGILGMFVASGRLYQSRTIKVGKYYRVYAALCTLSGNFVIYTDDFGEKWNVLGDIETSCVPKGDEPKCEELPDGSVIISSRVWGGRYYNIYRYTDAKAATGSWQTPFASTEVSTVANAVNGEIYRLKAMRNADGVKVDLLLQSTAFGNDRNNVGIYFKELASKADYESPEAIGTNWDGAYQVSTESGAYSTMTLQRDGCIGFFFEENCQKGGYDMQYMPLTLGKITSGAYTLLKE